MSELTANDNDIASCKALATAIRKHVLRMTHRARSSHVGSNFSMADVLAALYARILRVDPRSPKWSGRDRFILSKGHAAAGLYAVLAERGFFPLEWLDDFYLDGAKLAGHVSDRGVPGIEVSTGSLGHGLSIACGLALVGKSEHRTHRVFTLVSDGECDEGSLWEAALFAPHHKLDNLTVIVDYNKIQSMGWTREILNLDPLAEKWAAFGWGVREIDGHDFSQILEALANLPVQQGKPSCVIAHTIKGKGVSFMENQVLWHYRAANDEEYRQALVELEARP